MDPVIPLIVALWPTIYGVISVLSLVERAPEACLPVWSENASLRLALRSVVNLGEKLLLHYHRGVKINGAGAVTINFGDRQSWATLRLHLVITTEDKSMVVNLSLIISLSLGGCSVHTFCLIHFLLTALCKFYLDIDQRRLATGVQVFDRHRHQAFKLHIVFFCKLFGCSFC